MDLHPEPRVQVRSTRGRLFQRQKLNTEHEERWYLEMLQLPSVIIQLPPLVFNLRLFLPFLLFQHGLKAINNL